MAEVQTHAANADDVILKARGFWTKNQKPIGIAVIALIVIFGGWYAYKKLCSGTKRRRSSKNNV